MPRYETLLKEFREVKEAIRVAVLNNKSTTKLEKRKLELIVAIDNTGGQWKDGGTFGFDKPTDDISFCSDSRGVVHAVARNGTELRHYMRGSIDPFPWEAKGRAIPGDYAGSGHVEIWEKDECLLIIWPDIHGNNRTWWEKPRKFKDPSNINPKLFKIGASWYPLQGEKDADIKWFLAQIIENGGNSTEIFLLYTWPFTKKKPWKHYKTSGHLHSPYKIVDKWSEPKFGDYEFPMFDLTKWNNQTWRKLKLIMSECRRLRITLFIRVQDHCSVKHYFGKRHYPYNKDSNVQRYRGGRWEKGIQPFLKPFNRKLMETIKATQLTNYNLIIENESDAIGNDTEKWKDDNCISFHQWYIDDFASLGVDVKKQIIINIHRDKPRKHFEKLGYLIEHHHVCSPQAMKEKYQEFGNNIFTNGDGPDKYAKGLKAANGVREASFDQGVEMGKFMKWLWLNNPNLFIAYCYVLKSCEPPGISPGDWNVRLAKFPALQGLVEGLR